MSYGAPPTVYSAPPQKYGAPPTAYQPCFQPQSTQNAGPYGQTPPLSMAAMAPPPAYGAVPQQASAYMGGPGMYLQPSAPPGAGTSFCSPFSAGGASIVPVKHPGREAKPGDELVAVVVTICAGSSYDTLFSSVPQLAGDGKRVATYAASYGSLPHILGELTGRKPPTAAPGLREHLPQLISDIRAVLPESVVFNWECCSGCHGDCFPRGVDIFSTVKDLLDRGFMVMFSDFSLKALIQGWREDLLGPNPFVRTGEFGGTFRLRFDSRALTECPSPQLQKLGELATNGEAQQRAMSNTIAFSVNWSKADCRDYACHVLTVMTERSGQPVVPTEGASCEAAGHRGWAGHVLLTYPKGGRLLVSAGHWIELSHIDMTEERVLKAAAAYGASFQMEVQSALASSATAEIRAQQMQSYGQQMVQQACPSPYSMAPMNGYGVKPF